MAEANERGPCGGSKGSRAADELRRWNDAPHLDDLLSQHSHQTVGLGVARERHDQTLPVALVDHY